MEYPRYVCVLAKLSVKVYLKKMFSVSSSPDCGSEDSTTKLLHKCGSANDPLEEQFTLHFEFCKPKSHKKNDTLEESEEHSQPRRCHEPSAKQRYSFEEAQRLSGPLKQSSPPIISTRSPPNSIKRKKSTVRKTRDLSHYNSVPPIESEARLKGKSKLARSCSHSYIPLKSSGSASSASTIFSHASSPITKTKSNDKIENLSEEDDFECGFRQNSVSSVSLRKSPNTSSSSSSTVFKFPPLLPSPNSRSKSRRFSFSSSPRSPVAPRSPEARGSSSFGFESLPRSPSKVNSSYPSSEFSCGVDACGCSTTDLTDVLEESAASVSRPSSPVSPRPRSRVGSVKSGLAYLASRRESRDSQASEYCDEELAPLNFANTARSRQRRTSNFLELPVPDHVRPRVCSLPEKPYNPRAGDELYRLRTFSITHKGSVVNCGDSIISRRSRSNTSVNSTTSRHSHHSNASGASPFEGSCCGSSYNNISTDSTGEEVPKYRVVLFGDTGVGKTALVSQFMTSEYMNTYDASLDDEFGEKAVSVLLDGTESEMVFIDHPASEMSVENSLSTYEPHACVVVYSIVNRSSLKAAEEILNYLWRENFTQEKSVIVVGNKADLARARVISASEGKALAASRGCKFIETSSGIQHNVDELLVGILKQIRLRETRERKQQKKVLSHGSRASLTFNIARDIFHRICLKDSKSKSCENLHVL
nr:PREDICTED: uncharacterized protein LOC109043549 [Bemisia tabaci]